MTLTGPGGSGKTRLALEAASTLVPEYKAGVFWIGLAALRDPALVTETIAQTLGAKDGLAEHIGEREMLLLIDNLEQVVEAAPELSSLLQGCPNLTLLVHKPRAPARAGARSSTRSHRCRSRRPSPSSASAPSSSRATRLPSSVAVSTRSRSRSSSPPPARRRSRPRRSWSGSRSGSTCSRVAATPIPASRRCGRPSSGATTSSPTRSSASFGASPSSPAAARSRLPRRSATPISTRCSRSSRRAFSASPL